MATVIVDVNINSEDAARKAKELAASIKEIKDEQKELKKSGDENSAAYVQNAQQLRVLQAEQKSYIQLSQAEIGSNNDLRAQLALLTQQYNALGREERDNTDAGKLLQGQIKAVSDELKVNEGAVGDNRRNVGNYSDALSDARSTLEKFIPGLSEVTAAYDASKNALNSLNGIQKAGIITTEGLSGAFKVLKIALVSTGIGAIVVLFGSLIAYLSTTQEGIDKITSVTRPLVAVFQSLLGAAQNLGKTLVDSFSNPKKVVQDLLSFLEGQVMNRLKSFGKIVDGILNFDISKVSDGLFQAATGVENLTGKITNASKEAGKFLTDAANKGSEIDRLTKEIEKTEIRNIELVGRLNEEFKAQNKIAEDTTKSLKEREAAALRTVNIQKQINVINKEQNDREIELATLKTTLNDTDRATQKELAELRKRGNDQTASALEAETTANNKLNIIRQTGYNEAKKAADERKKEADEANKALLDSQQRVSDLALSARQKELVDINRDIDEKIKTYKKYGQTTSQLEKERIARLEEARRGFEQEDLAKYREYLVKVEQATQSNIDAQVASISNKSEREAAQRELANQRELADIDKQITATSVAIALGDVKQVAILEQQSQERMAIIRRQKEEETAIEIEEQLKLDLALAQLAFDTAKTPEQELEARALFLEAKTALDIEKAQGDADLIAEINERAAFEQDAIDEAVMANKIARIQEFSTVFQSVVNKNSLAAKIAADISARIDAAQQLRNNVLIVQEQVKAIVSQGKLIFPLNIAAIFSTIAALAAGIASAKTLFSAPKAFATGGIFESDGTGALLSGAGTGTSDSINARLSNGESVINARSTKMFLPMLNAINQAGGGKALAPGFAMATGGIASGSFVTDIADGANSQVDLINGISAALLQAPAPIVDVRDIVREANRNERVVVNATI